MAKSKKHAVLIGLCVAVLSGVIVSILRSEVCRSWAWGVVTWIGGIIVGLWQHLGSSISMPFAVFYALATVCGVAVLWVVASLRRPSGPSFLDYRHDEFFGMRWEWDYQDGDRLSEPTPRCLRDSTLLVALNASGYDVVPRVIYCCETCRTEYGPFEGNRWDVADKAKRQIERKIKTGEWEQVVAQHKSSCAPLA